jgi:16S rRNA (uracil1498-N3)-methyltransferase
MPRFFVTADDVRDGTARLQGNEYRHLQRVLRLREGDRVTLFDDAGREHAGVVTSLTPRVAVVRISATTTPARESPLAVTLYVALPKGRKLDLVVEKATELGAHAIAPCTSAFGGAGESAARAKQDRWQRIALAAAKQSGRTAIPSIGAALSFAEVVARSGEHDARLLFYEGENVVPLGALALPSPPRSIAVVVGAEGGFSRDEVEEARRAGFAIVGLGPRILRCETAALVAVAVVQSRFGDLG